MMMMMMMMMMMTMMMMMLFMIFHDLSFSNSNLCLPDCVESFKTSRDALISV
jgi:hypothetical protein